MFRFSFRRSRGIIMIGLIARGGSLTVSVVVGFINVHDGDNTTAIAIWEKDFMRLASFFHNFLFL